MKNKKGSEGLAMDKIVILILVILVVAASIWALLKYGGLDTLRNVIPGFGNKTGG